MAYTTFPITYGPSFPVERTKAPRLIVSNYGDGYEQASGDGINTLKPQVHVQWQGLTSAEAASADTFLSGLNGVTPFLWTFPGDGSAGQWTCRSWKVSIVGGGGNYVFDADFVQNFNP